MLTEYLDKRLARARYKRLKDGSYFGEVPGVQGVWANARTLPRCRAELREVLEDWLVLKVRNKETVPGLRIRTDRRSLVR
jgi:predicted RNase H-like HicB family nuclease